MSGPRHYAPDINALAWLLWFLGAATLPLVTRNPFYLALNLAVVMVVQLARPASGGAARAWRLFAYVGSVAAAFAVGFNVLTVHVGDRVFAELPDWLPIAGGPLTINALVYGLSTALAISALLFAAATFNSAVRHADLIRLLPNSFARLGVAGSIAIAFVPQMIAAGRDIYDAQRARGVPFRSARDATGLLIPLLATGMERAVALSEALETRGFGHSAIIVRPSAWRPAGFAAAALLLLAALALLALGRLGLALLTIVAALAVAFLASPKRGARRSRYRPIVWNSASWLVAIGAAGPPMLFLLSLAAGLDLRFEPFPRLEAPSFSPFAALTLGLLAPAWLRRS